MRNDLFGELTQKSITIPGQMKELQYRGLAASPCVRLRGRVNLNFSTTYAVDCGA